MLFWTNFVNWINCFIEKIQWNDSWFIHEWFIDEPDISVMNMIRRARVDFQLKTCFCLFNKLYRPLLCYFYVTFAFFLQSFIWLFVFFYYLYSIIYLNCMPNSDQ